MSIRQATRNDRERVIEILSAAFDSNPAVNDTMSPGGSRAKKLRALMEYLVDTGYEKQGVFVTDDLLGAAIIYDPVQFPETFADKWRQLKLVSRCIGWSRLRYASAKDKKMKSFRPAAPHLYFNMLGTHPSAQRSGIGTKLLNYVMELSASTSRTVYLETSVASNVALYKKMGFTVHGEWKIRDDYHVHFMNWSK